MYNVQMYGGPTVLPDSLVASGRSRVGRFLAGQQGGGVGWNVGRAGGPEQAGREPSAMGVRYQLMGVRYQLITPRHSGAGVRPHGCR